MKFYGEDRQAVNNLTTRQRMNLSTARLSNAAAALAVACRDFGPSSQKYNEAFLAATVAAYHVFEIDAIWDAIDDAAYEAGITRGDWREEDIEDDCRHYDGLGAALDILTGIRQVDKAAKLRRDHIACHGGNYAELGEFEMSIADDNKAFADRLADKLVAHFDALGVEMAEVADLLSDAAWRAARKQGGAA